MDLIQQKRDAVIRENNTAQARLLSLLENLPQSLEVLQITEELHGDLDFSVISERQMGKLTSIVLPQGEVTSIMGLPTNLVKLECPNNFLTLLENLPTTLETLNISYNYVEKINIGALQVLHTLNISHNRIKKLENPPASLRELRCDNNELGALDLKGVEHLDLLNVSNNPITLIENLPEGTGELIMDNCPSIEFRHSALDALQAGGADSDRDREDSQKKNYQDALNDFFRLKQEYETKLHTMKRNAFKSALTKRLGKQAVLAVKPTCIYCKRPVGTIFTGRIDNKYSILCGDKENPCKLNIQIFNGSNTYFEELLYTFREHLEEIKERIIRQKLDTVFSYVSEEKSVELFEKELGTYNTDSAIYKELVDVYTDYYHNEQNREAILKKNQAVFTLNERVKALLEEYVKTDNRELLSEAVRVQVREIYPEIRNRRMLENEVVELDRELVSNKEVFTIFKYPIELSKLDYHSGEKPRVLQYVGKEL
jgi:hypothetical protein